MWEWQCSDIAIPYSFPSCARLDFGDNKTMNLVNFFPIIHCEFEYSCPLNWGDLESTEDEMVRYCQQCEKSVTLWLDDAQIDAAWEQGRCIAHPFILRK